MSFLFTLAAFLFALGVLIVIHELGHYLVARWCGVKILRFSVGFGKPLFLRRYGKDQTEWVIAALPLGGYVKMLDEREGNVSSADRPRAFNQQSVYKRFAIVFAGPLANFLLAIVLYWALFMHGVPGIKPVLGPVPAESSAARAGVQAGDEIVAIDGNEVATWQDVRWTLLQDALEREDVRLSLRRSTGEQVDARIDLSGLTPDDLERNFLQALGLSMYQPDLTSRIGRVLPGGAAARAGIEEGDIVQSVDGRPVATWDDLVQVVRASPGKTLSLLVQRESGVVALDLTPEATEEAGVRVGKIGAGPWVDPKVIESLTTEVRYGPLQSVAQAISKTWDTSVFSLQMLAKMVMGEVSWKNLSGPITIADFAGQSANLGWLPYLSFLALISISLGVLNLLPIPLLDGGHLMYYMVEIIKGTPVSERVMEIGQQVGIVLLLTLMAFAFYNDINRLVTG